MLLSATAVFPASRTAAQNLSTPNVWHTLFIWPPRATTSVGTWFFSHRRDPRRRGLARSCRTWLMLWLLLWSLRSTSPSTLNLSCCAWQPVGDRASVRVNDGDRGCGDHCFWLGRTLPSCASRAASFKSTRASHMKVTCFCACVSMRRPEEREPCFCVSSAPGCQEGWDCCAVPDCRPAR